MESPRAATFIDLDAGGDNHAIRHVAAVYQVWVVTGTAIGRNVLVVP
jgi:hypothetical protein